MGRKGRTIRVFKLDVEEELFLESLEATGMRGIPGYEKNNREKKLKF